jgi:hypothetical protein
MTFQNLIIPSGTTAGSFKCETSTTACFHEVCRYEYVTGRGWRRICCYCGVTLEEVFEMKGGLR